MADLKISQLSSATALTGTEVVPVVQSGSTKKATINQILSPAAGNGVNFTANTPAAGMTSQLLNWYEEGTFTPAYTGSTSNPTITYNEQIGYYTRIGNVVYFTIRLNAQASAVGSGDLRVSLPFTTKNVSGYIAGGGNVQFSFDFVTTQPAVISILPNNNYLTLMSGVSSTSSLSTSILNTGTPCFLMISGFFFV